MPLYGHELTEDWDSLTAAQDWAVDLTKEFVGAAAMRRLQREGLPRRVAGFELEGKRIARAGAAVFAAGRPAGVVTSGTLSPTLERNIAMGLLESPLTTPGTAVEIDIRGARVPARVVSLPFYKRT
jgi:aminomethyltransferase